MNFPLDLLSFLRKARRIAALTGAGVSQESGLRTFRDAQTGLWAQYRPEDLATPEAFARDPKLVWDWYAMRREKARLAEPNPGHFALAEMEKRIPEFTLITQNVDGLHRRAGSVNVLELHGNLQRVKCSVCGEQATVWDDSGPDVPQCSRCAGLLRPDVVWFGESLPRKELEAAIQAARMCDVFFSIGTSGLVQPAASLAYVAREKGALLVEINAEPTPLTATVDFFFQGKSGEILPALVDAVRKVGD
ncbi:MAG: NAD-dependent protein deacylase [Anaerolineae bacterium]|nr:MAG: NAD-dependent protein deacylase [Anaerolineae bacterium]